jgi:hypothetical protein
VTLVRNFEVVLGQTLYHFFLNCVTLCNVIILRTTHLVIQFDTPGFSWCDNSVILKLQFYFIFVKCFEYYG